MRVLTGPIQLFKDVKYTVGMLLNNGVYVIHRYIGVSKIGLLK